MSASFLLSSSVRRRLLRSSSSLTFRVVNSVLLDGAETTTRRSDACRSCFVENENQQFYHSSRTSPSSSLSSSSIFRSYATSSSTTTVTSTAATEKKKTKKKKEKNSTKTLTKTKAKDSKGTEKEELKTLMDMKKPGKWYPLARTMQREIILHVGPTNSGKTHAAMERLKRASSGVYCSPLRLLAWEISETLNKYGTKCDLVTGQELRKVENAEHIACTVEMVDVNKVVDCAVIDEIHLIGDDFRGYAFTRALLGTPALELHLCGDTSCVELIQKICKDTGDKLRIRNYERLSPLNVAEEHFSKKRLEQNIQKGDCFVAFSRKAVYALKNEIERRVPLRACVIYGGLPPEARSRQAELFNKPDSGYDLLIASDAIGMGLNLNIRRIIFNELTKFDGIETRLLTSPEVKQIAGRAGRYKMSYYDKGGGVVTTMDDGVISGGGGGGRRKQGDTANKDIDKKSELSGLQFIKNQLDAPVEALKTAGLAPTFEQILEYCAKVEGATLEDAMKALSSDAKVPKYYKMRKSDEVIRLAKYLENLGMEIEDHYTFAISPTSVDCPHSMKTLMNFANAFLNEGHVSVKLIPKSINKREKKSGADAQTRMNQRSVGILANLEEQHRAYDLYLWFARRMSAQFPEYNLAEALRVMCAHSIDAELQKLSTAAITESNRSKKSSGKKGGDSNKPVLQIEELDRKILRSAINRVNEERKNLSLSSQKQRQRKEQQQQQQRQHSTDSTKPLNP
jgi:ATP-dependent RNA helicase SUPV3L1/SUV3